MVRKLFEYLFLKVKRIPSAQKVWRLAVKKDQYSSDLKPKIGFLSDRSGLSCHLEILTDKLKCLKGRAGEAGIIEIDVSTIRSTKLNAEVDHNPDGKFYSHTLIIGNKPGGQSLTNDEIRFIIENKLYKWIKEPTLI